MSNRFLRSAAWIASLLLAQIAFSSAATAFVCTGSDAFVDWLGVGFDVDGGPCPVTASVTDGVGTATVSADVSPPDTLAMDFAFTIDGGASFFSGDIEAAMVATFDVGAEGADLVFQDSGPTAATYSLAGPGTAVFDAPFPGAPVTLTTPGSYELTIHQVYIGGSTAVPLFGSASVTFVGAGRRFARRRRDVA